MCVCVHGCCVCACMGGCMGVCGCCVSVCVCVGGGGVLCVCAGGGGWGGGKESPCYCDFFDIVHIFNSYCTTLCIVVYLYNICELLFSFQNEMVNVLKISHHQAVRMGRGSTV